MEENVFSGLREYNPANWVESNVRAFNNTEKSIIKSAKVVASDYGNSACFLMVNGKNQYLPMDRNSTKTVGEELNINDIQLVTLSKEGEKDIKRVRI